MPDTISQYRVARLSYYPPPRAGLHGRYVVIANTIRRGIPHAQVLVDGTLPAMPAFPTTEEVLEAFDAAIRQHMLAR